MKNIILALVIVSSFVSFGAKANDIVPIVLVKVVNGKTKIVSGTNKAFETTESVAHNKRRSRRGVRRARFQRRLNKVVNKLAMAIDKSVKINDQAGGKYRLSEVEVGLTLSAEFGIGEIASVGGNTGIVLHFVR